MATKVHMEALSPTMEEGELVSWLKTEGDAVEQGDVLAEIETDKATMELVARGSGVFRKQLLEEGGVAAVGAVIGVIAEEDEDISEILEEVPAGAEEPTHEEPEEKAAQKEGPRAAEGDVDRAAAELSEGVEAELAAGGAAEAVRPTGDGGRIKASPLARRLAAEAGVELEGVRGSGPGGRIVKRDVEEAGRREEPARPAGAPAAAAPTLEAADVPEVEEIPVSQMRKAIARRLVTSIGPVPTFYLTTEVDVGRLLELRKRINARLEESDEKISVNDLIIKATAVALRRHPEVNASWGEDVIRRYGRAHIGVAVATEGGLITPIVRDADRKGVVRIGREVKELAARARDRKLQPEEYTGATFSVSNLGMFGIDEFTAIINPPEAAILAVGQAEEKPVAEDGEMVIRQRMRLTMSCDHRVIDGAMGARFLQTLRTFLEEPAMMAV